MELQKHTAEQNTEAALA